MVVIASGDIVKSNKEAVNRMLDAQKEAIDMLSNDAAKAASFITSDFITEDTLKKPTARPFLPNPLFRLLSNLKCSTGKLPMRTLPVWMKLGK